MSTTPPALRPLGIGDILDRAVRIYRSHFVTLVSIIAVISVPLLLIQVLAAALTLPWTSNLATGAPFASESATGLFLLAQSLTSFVTFFAVIFQVGAIAAFVSEQQKGNTLTLRQAYGYALRHWVSLIVATVLLALAFVGLSIGLIIPVTLGATGLSLAGSGSDAAGGLAVLCLCVLFVPLIGAILFFSVRWLFYNQAIVLEDYNSTGGLGRSWKLVKGKFWRTLGFFFILAILVAAFTTGPIYLLTFLSFLIPSLALSTIMTTVAQTLLQVIILPIQYIALTLYYFDLRVRQEGYDLQLQLATDDKLVSEGYVREPYVHDVEALPPIFPPTTGEEN